MSQIEYGWTDTKTVQAPIGILLAAALLMIVGVLGLFLDPLRVWSILGYALSGVAAVSAIGWYRFLDARLRTKPGYRLIPFASVGCQLLLAATWLISIGDAWRLATDLSR
jgi:hypothetical protein